MDDKLDSWEWAYRHFTRFNAPQRWGDRLVGFGVGILVMSAIIIIAAR